jgi:hypothetical protein
MAKHHEMSCKAGHPAKGMKKKEHEKMEKKAHGAKSAHHGHAEKKK